MRDSVILTGNLPLCGKLFYIESASYFFYNFRDYTEGIIITIYLKLYNYDEIIHSFLVLIII
jgi:hypothetical protein